MLYHLYSMIQLKYEIFMYKSIKLKLKHRKEHIIICHTIFDRLQLILYIYKVYLSTI